MDVLKKNRFYRLNWNIIEVLICLVIHVIEMLHCCCCLHYTQKGPEVSSKSMVVTSWIFTFLFFVMWPAWSCYCLGVLLGDLNSEEQIIVSKISKKLDHREAWQISDEVALYIYFFFWDIYFWIFPATGYWLDGQLVSLQVLKMFSLRSLSTKYTFNLLYRHEILSLLKI